MNTKNYIFLGYNQLNRRYAIFKTTFLFIVTILTTCLVFYQSDYLSRKSYSPIKPLQRSSRDHQQPMAKDEDTIMLEKVLSQASMKEYEKTVIITTLNAAWTEPNSIFDLFLESFEIGNETQSLVQHLVIVALDKKAYARCLNVHSHCFALTTYGVDFSRFAFFGGEEYLKMMWRRIEFLTTVLKLGYNFVFTDADIMWFRNPFPRFIQDGDFQIACDRYRHNSTSMDNFPNGGFTYVKSNSRTIEFYKYWHKARDRFPGKHDQDVLNLIKYDQFISEIGLEFRFLNTAYFSGLCEPGKDLNFVVTMHANCCGGIKNKIHDLKLVIDDWKNYFNMVGYGNRLSTRISSSWRSVEWICGLKPH